MDRHLVAVEVGIERRAHERVDPDRLALDQHRLEGLDAQAVEGGGPVEQDRVILDDVLENLVDLRIVLLHDLLGAFDRLGLTALLELVDDEGLEKLHRHRFRQAALVQLELRTDHDDRSARVVDALAEQILAETALLPLEHVAERLERALPTTPDRLRPAAVVEERIDGLLKHALLVAQNDFRRAHVDQLLQAVVSVDDPTIQVVQIGRGEASAIERDERTQVGRNDGNHIHDHPLGLVARLRRRARVAQRVHDLEPLELLLLAVLGRLVRDLVAEPHGETVQSLPVRVAVLDLLLVWVVQQLEQRPSPLGPDFRLEVLVGLVARLHAKIVVFVLVEKLKELDLLLARVRHHVGRIVDDLFEVAQRHAEQITELARERLEEPDMRHRHGELDVAHTLTSNLRERDLDSATVAHVPTEANPLELPAMALPVLHRPEDPLTEQTVALGLERAVVDRLRLHDLTERPGANLFGRSNLHLYELEVRTPLIAGPGKIDHYPSSPSVTLRPRACSSFTSTLNDSGIPGFGRFSPFTMAS